MDTYFDPSETLGKSPWELAKNLEDHFAGWEVVDIALTDQEWEELVYSMILIADVACQTPAEWDEARPTEAAPEATPRPATERLVVLRPGTTTLNPALIPACEIWRDLVLTSCSLVAY